MIVAFVRQAFESMLSTIAAVWVGDRRRAAGWCGMVEAGGGAKFGSLGCRQRLIAKFL
jgi:hypothetical protein